VYSQQLNFTVSLLETAHATEKSVYCRVLGSWNANTMSSLGTPARTNSVAIPSSVQSSSIQNLPSRILIFMYDTFEQNKNSGECAAIATVAKTCRSLYHHWRKDGFLRQNDE
jgi:hypothetical protein